MKRQRQGGFLVSKIHLTAGRIFARMLRERQIDTNPAHGRILFVLFVIVPLVIYAIRKPHWQTADGTADFEPFTWQKEGRHPATESGTTPVAVAPAGAPAPAAGK